DTEHLNMTTYKKIKDLGVKVSDEEKQAAEAAKDELKKVRDSDDTDDIKAKKEALEEKVQQLSVKLYEQMAQEQQANQGQEASGDDDDVVDADFKEVDDEEEDDKK